MNLEIGQNIDNSKVRLNFKKGNSLPDYMPSYEIQKNKADEFVTEYNRQSSDLKKMTLLSVITATAFGGVVSSYFKNKIWIPIGLVSGFFSGLGIGAANAFSKRSKLMDKYDVIQISEKV